jgi:hypothetical protein
MTDLMKSAQAEGARQILEGDPQGYMAVGGVLDPVKETS